MLLHPAASPLPERATHIHHDQHHHHRLRRRCRFVFSRDDPILPGVHLRPTDRQRILDGRLRGVLLEEPEACRLFGLFRLRCWLTLRHDCGGDDDDNDNCDEAASGCRLACRNVIRPRRIPARDCPDQDAHLQLLLLHRLRLSCRFVPVSACMV